MKRIKMYSVALSLLFLSTTSLSAQENNLFNNSKHRIGLVLGFGGQNVNQLLTELNDADAKKIREYLIAKGLNPDELGLAVKYHYTVTLFQAQYYWAFLRRKTLGLELLIQPQYNLTKFRQVDHMVDETKGFEVGLNAGILIRKNILKDLLSMYALISSGPHYVSGVPQRQSKGFIFSDNLFIGVNTKLFKNTYLDIRPGFRHISNAGLTHPNGGVNDFVINGGILINL